MKTVSMESALLSRLGQHTLAGFYEEKNAPIFSRTARALRRYCENAAAPAYSGGYLYPHGTCSLWSKKGEALCYSYSFGLTCVEAELDKLASAFKDEAERQMLEGVVRDARTYAASPLSGKYSVGGRGYTHSILNYGRILSEGLVGYRSRLERGTADGSPFHRALLDMVDGIKAMHAACLRSLVLACPEPDDERRKLIRAFEHIPYPAATFYEAMVMFNFFWYLDGADSIGRFDQFMYPYYAADMAAGRIADDEARRLLRAYWKNMDDNNGWHMTLGGGRASGPSYNDLTALCLETLCACRRPNTGIRVRADMGDGMWERVFDTIMSGAGNPALYNEDAYAKSIPEYTGVNGPDAEEFAFGGCTELMFHGLSNVGSLDAGINLIEVLDGTIKAGLADAENYDAFLQQYRADLAANIDEMIDEVNLNQEYKALYRPLPLRTLFIDDCIDRGVEYNAGGARYNGSVVNVAGLSNAANSLYVVMKMFDGGLGASKSELIETLANDWAGCGDLHARAKRLEKYGNNIRSVDAVAEDIAEFVFERIAAKRCRRGNGFFLPSCLMFATFAQEGYSIDATPDGRRRSSPIADSIGPMQGTDRGGPTSMLLSVARLPQKMAIGTLVLNMSLPRAVFESQETRDKLRILIQTYFELGGLQIQFTVVDEAALRDAVAHPENYENLIVRIGGYTEYFNRLTQELKEEVLKRTSHRV